MIMRFVPSHRQFRRIAFRVIVAATVLAGVVVPSTMLGASASATDATVAATGSNCGGVTLYKSLGVPWVCSFDEEFSGTSIDRTKWKVQTTNQFGFQSGDECMVDTPYTVAVMNGHLNLSVFKATKPFMCYSPKGNYATSYAGGSVYTRAFSQLYGRFEVRAKFAQGNGISGAQGALWMFPISTSATALLTGPSEIDIAEAYSVHPDNVIPTVHTYTALLNYYYPCSVPNWGAAYHTYAVTWSYKKISFFYDNVECYHIATVTSGAVAPFLVALSQAMGVKPNAPSSSTVLPAKLQIDYVRVWK
jgi:beta-glucanase (GH16 family)